MNYSLNELNKRMHACMNELSYLPGRVGKAHWRYVVDTVVGPGVVKDHGLSVIPLSISGSLGVVTEMSGSIEKRMKQLIGVNNLLRWRQISV